MSKAISFIALVIFVVAVGVNFVFFGAGGDAGSDSGGADAANNGPGNPSGEDFITPDDIEVPDQPGGGVPVGEVDIRVKEGRTNGQREFAREFVRTVYGSSGVSDNSAGSSYSSYLDSASGYMQRDSYEVSGGWGAIEAREESGGEVGGDNAAVMVEYEIFQGPALGTSISTVPLSEAEKFTAEDTFTAEDLDPASLAVVSYAVGDSYDESVEGGPEDYADASVLLTGSIRYYTQTLVLVPLLSPDEASGESERWTALAGSEPVPIDNPNSNAPDQSAPKVGEPAGDHGEGDGESDGGGDGNEG